MKLFKFLIILILLIGCSKDKSSFIYYAEKHLIRNFDNAENLLIILPDKGCNSCNFEVLKRVGSKKNITVVITGYSKKTLTYTYSMYEEFSNIIYLTKPFSDEAIIFSISEPSFLNYSNELVSFSLNKNFDDLKFMIENSN
jgi:hypothetical protein